MLRPARTEGGLICLLPGKKGLLIGALALGVLLLLLPWGRSGAETAAGEEAPAFSLDEAEERIARALRRIAGAGEVTVVLTLDTGLQREYARNTEDSREDGSGESRIQARSEVASSRDEALTVRYAYPRYRGALVVVQGDGAGLKLEITQAVSALTGLGADRITVVRGG